MLALSLPNWPMAGALLGLVMLGGVVGIASDGDEKNDRAEKILKDAVNRSNVSRCVEAQSAKDNHVEVGGGLLLPRGMQGAADNEVSQPPGKLVKILYEHWLVLFGGIAATCIASFNLATLSQRIEGVCSFLGQILESTKQVMN
ncbi:hypothetical protein K3X48_08535 [Aliiroseovarius crassostreae]|uniref:Uncharacterized protein n=1 Tax=Aliiroseovarius crassostreae TaxID=154981 RepID=A0A9Q9H9P9_9RHOB|nr:hypothetical protein [Aliiroseovarius crassostreae]UWP94302.1 hypothetical protein K3X48_08535 [Aliiroseovarius crassostreae]